MPLYPTRIKVGAAETDLEYCVDGEYLCLKQGTLKLEQKIAELFEKLRGSVYRYLMAVLGNPAEAEEITQEAFLRLYDRLHGGQSVRNVRAWIFRVAHNLAINLQKDRKDLAPLDSPPWDKLCKLRQDPVPNPEEKLLQKEKYHKLQAALARLSPQQQQCLILRAEGLPNKAIAEILGINTWTAAKSVQRSVEKITQETHD
jgi:RNA polymerase sigma-70 factor, ECF subfamily